MGSSKPRDRFFSNPGSRLADVHAIRIDDKGHKTLVKTGEKKDVYAIIASHADEVDIKLLLERADAEGYQILDQRQAMSGDVTIVPKSFMEAQQLLQEQENKFNQLPLDIRKKFNFAFTEYIAEAGNDFNSWLNKMGLVKEEAAKVPEPIAAETGKESE